MSLVVSMTVGLSAFAEGMVYSRSGMAIERDALKLKDIDHRTLRNSASPRFLNAVGRLMIITGSGDMHYCTAFPPAFAGNSNQAKYFETAAHCLIDQKKGTMLPIRQLSWSVFIDGWRLVKSEMKIASLDIPNDVAVLEAQTPLSFQDVTPLSLADFSVDSDVTYMVAGYHGDLGNQGLRMAIDAPVEAGRLQIDEGMVVVETVAFSGASGGPVLAIDDSGQAAVVGIIRGNGRTDKQFLINGQRGSDKVEITPSKWLSGILSRPFWN
ncbi:serine protease [Alteromonas sp. 14N.309.X.WAT.G.H12]|uniref:trypsin-like serine peptidase n=1 Tax=Alteromonas sp. 14N.309.X.WAT.G.H12 TaxID=3120824 RepID=UPI002FD462DB